jgi:hypothetical protein
MFNSICILYLSSSVRYISHSFIFIPVLSRRTVLYRFSEADKEWKERARGDVKFLKNPKTQRIRAVMRQEKTLKVRLNQYVGDVELKPNAGSDKAWTWRWADFATDSGDVETHSFAIRFRTADNAKEFNEQWEKARQNNIEHPVTETETKEIEKTEEAAEKPAETPESA